MHKIPTLFVRDPKTRRVTSAVTPGCEWVLHGEGVATVKLDGTCCRIKDGRLWKRHDVRVREIEGGKAPGDRVLICPAGRFQLLTALPDGFVAAEVMVDGKLEAAPPHDGHWPGWVPVGEGAEDRWHREAWECLAVGWRREGTYELLGPKVQGNPEKYARHELVEHGRIVLSDCPRDFEGLRAYLAERDYEGVVFWREEGNPGAEMVKIKGKDFGQKRGK